MAAKCENKSGGKICCSNLCTAGSKALGNDDSRVEVKAFELKKKKGNWHVDWASDGSATFHRQCWSTLVTSTKGDLPNITLMDIERSMILEAKKTAEYHDGDRILREEARRIADIMRTCKYCIAFTGAGISTAAGIGDFRGKEGKWTDRDKAKNYGSKPSKTSKAVAMDNLRPTYTHEALCKLVDLGILKFVISQNVDSLHRLSGIPAEKLAELHGNCFVVKCEDCGMRYELNTHWRRTTAQSFPAKPCPKCRISHRIGRTCTQPGCKGYLMNTIINFGDYLESDVLSTAEHHAKMAECVLILGSSLRVSPANDLVTMGKEPVRLILCNRQTTPYDADCVDHGSRVYGDCDVLMESVMQELLSSEELREWHAGKGARSLQYDMQRSV